MSLIRVAFFLFSRSYLQLFWNEMVRPKGSARSGILLNGFPAKKQNSEMFANKNSAKIRKEKSSEQVWWVKRGVVARRVVMFVGVLRKVTHISLYARHACALRSAA